MLIARLFLCRSPRAAVNGRSAQWFGTSPRRAIPEGHTTSITRTAPQSANPPSFTRATSRVRVHKLLSHYRSLSTTTSRSAGGFRVGTPRPAISVARRSPSRHPPPIAKSDASRYLYRNPPSHVPCRSRRTGSRRLYAGHRLASKRAARQAYPGIAVVTPVLMPVS